jgi:hypothetical protein
MESAGNPMFNFIFCTIQWDAALWGLTREVAGAVGYGLTFPSKPAHSGCQDDRKASHVYSFYVATLLCRL